MIDLKMYLGPYGIPIYHQRLPEMVKASSLAWVMMTGAADDESVGSHGLYHWFEHIPFRGTKNYPNGTEQISRPITRIGGNINAWTNAHATCFNVEIHSREWRHGLSVITDLLSYPLLREDDVSAERDIIRQEILGRTGKPSSALWYEMPKILWGGHPFGHPTLGCEAMLDMMNPAIMVEAHKKGYDRSRLVLFAVGSMSIEEVVAEVEKIAHQLPSNDLSTRRQPQHFGELPKWKSGKITRTETDFPSSIITMLFPHHANASMEENFLRGEFLHKLFSWGGLASPLMRIVREERHLVYGTGAFNQYVPGGGFFGFQAEAKRGNIQKILTAYEDTINDPGMCSSERIAEIVDGICNSLDMIAIDPDDFVNDGIHSLIRSGKVMNHEEYRRIVQKFDAEQAKSLVSELRLEKSHIVISEGMREKE